MANAVLVVDMLRGFLEEGNPLYCGADSRKIIAHIERLLERESKKGLENLLYCRLPCPRRPGV